MNITWIALALGKRSIDHFHFWNSEREEMLLWQTNPVGVELFFHVKTKPTPNVEWAFFHQSRRCAVYNKKIVMLQSPKDHNGHGSRCSTNQTNHNKEVGIMPSGHRVHSNCYLKILFPWVLHFQKQQTHFKFINHLLYLFFLFHVMVTLNLLCLHKLASANQMVIVKKSSQKTCQLTVARQLANRRPIVGRQSADRFYPKNRLRVGWQTTDSWRCVGNMSVTCR